MERWKGNKESRGEDRERGKETKVILQGVEIEGMKIKAGWKKKKWIGERVAGRRNKRKS